jgi:MFS family permease
MSPADLDAEGAYWHAVDHPALFHWVDYWLLAVLRIDVGDVPDVLPDQTYDWHMENGRVAPRRPVMVLRCANAAAYILALAALYMASVKALGSHAWGFLIGAALALPPSLGQFVAGGIKTDAYLAFFLAVCILAWLFAHCSHKPFTLAKAGAIGALAGLAVSTKFNGALVLLAYMSYLLTCSPGYRRLLLAAAAAVAAFAVFVAVNPVMWKAFVPEHGGPVWWWRYAADVMRQRAEVYEMHARMFRRVDVFALIAFFLPFWYLLPIVALLAAHSRREKWFAPVAFWAVFLVIGTVLTVRYQFTRYRMPIDMGLSVLAVLSLASVLRRLRSGEMTIRRLLTGSPGVG